MENLTMAQQVFGAIILLIVMIGAFIAMQNFSEDKNILVKFIHWIGFILVGYAVIGAIGGLFWLLAWVGIFIREIIMWLLESLLIPFSWVVTLF